MFGKILRLWWREQRRKIFQRLERQEKFTNGGRIVFDPKAIRCYNNKNLCQQSAPERLRHTKEERTMRKLFDWADRWIAAATWRDVALVKLCLCAMGVLIGLCIPQGRKKGVAAAASAVFAMTYAPLMAKFLSLMPDKE